LFICLYLRESPTV